ncbi:MAG: hypothetical protein WD426_02830 [Anditalea sp.]
MAEKYEDIDVLFREKLADHSEKPSPLAWEKLETRLSKRRKSPAFWMGIAASFLLLMGLVSLLWFSIRATDEQLNTLTQQEVIPEIPKKENIGFEPIQEEPIALDTEDRPSVTPGKKPAPTSKRQLPIRKSETEETTTEANGTTKEPPLMPEIENMELPPLDPDFLIAEKGLVGQEEIEVAYTVKIISNGISDQPEKETLVEEIENKIDKIGGLLNKADQGFADLQDAKNGLFASIITKKDNNKN